MPRRSSTNICARPVGNCAGCSRSTASRVLLKSSRESTPLLVCCVLFSIRSAISSSIWAECSSYSCCRRRTLSGNSNPGTCARYFHNAIRITKRARNSGCRRRTKLRNSRSFCRVGPNSKRTPSARDRTSSNWVLSSPRREYPREGSSGGRNPRRLPSRWKPTRRSC